MVRFILRSFLCIALSGFICECALAVGRVNTDPNIGGAVGPKIVLQQDARLAQKVTYEAQYGAVRQILEDLSSMTGVKFKAGNSSSDWPVRSRKMNIFVKNVRLSDLMESIAHAMKFRWSRDKDIDPPIYHLIVDRKATAAADTQKALADKRLEEICQKQRTEWIDVIKKYGSKSTSELESLRSTDPIAYEYGRRGAIRALDALFEEAPETQERFAAGRSFRISADKLTPQTRTVLFSAGNELWKYLQTVGVIGERTKQPAGYGDELKYEDHFDIVFHRLDVEGFTPNLRWGSASIDDCGYFHIGKETRDFEIAALPSRDSVWNKFRSLAHNKVLDGTDPDQAWVGSDAPYTEQRKSRQKLEESLYPSEPLNEKADLSDCDKPFKLKIDAPKMEKNDVMAANCYIAALQKALAEASGLGVVSDSWVNITGDQLPDNETKLAELLDKFSSQFNYNWDKNSDILEFRHRKWWKNRLNQIPDEWIAAWNENTNKKGVLSLDDLAAISALNFEQVEESLKRDKALGNAGIYSNILEILDRNGNLHWLRLYATLTPQLRALLMGNYGLNGFMLTSDQWKQAQTMFDRLGTTRADAVFRLELVPDMNAVYRFREIDHDSGEVDRMWEITLPKYTPKHSNTDKIGN